MYDKSNIEKKYDLLKTFSLFPNRNNLQVKLVETQTGNKYLSINYSTKSNHVYRLKELFFYFTFNPFSDTT